MANPARDFRNRAQAKWPGAVVVERTRNGIKHQHPTQQNRFMVDSSIGPVHIQNTQTEIDTAIEAVAENGFQYRMVLADYHVHFRDTFNVGNIFEYRDPVSQEWVIFDPQSINWIDENTSRQQIAIKQAVAAQINDDVVEFPQAYGTGKHFQYQAQTGRLQKLITIDNLSDLPAPTVQGNEIWFEAEFSLSTSAGVDLYLDGVKWAKANGVRVQTTNRIEFRDTTGQQVFWWLDFPRAWDSGEGQTIGHIEVRRQGGSSSLFVTVRIPYTWIQTATFPIYIDPTVDAQVSASADDAYQGGGGATTDITGAQIRWNASTTNTNYRGAARFAVSVPIGSTVDVMTMDVYCYNASVDDANCTFHAEDTSASPSAFSASADNLDRTLTTAGVLWSASSLGTGWQTSPEFKTIGQELVDTYGALSNINIISDDSEDATTSFWVRSYDGDTSLASKLHIEYTAGGGGTAIGLNSETDAAQAMSAAKAKGLGLNSETGSALAVGASKTKAIGLLTETETVFSLTVVKTRGLGQVTEAEAIFALGKAKAKAIGLNSETDSAQTMVATGSTILGLATETDTVFPITPVKTRALGLVTESEQGFALVAFKTVQLVLVTETDAFFALGRAKTRAIGLNTESDSALGMVITGATLLGQATETDTVFSITPLKTRALGLVTETEQGFALMASKTVQIGLVAETDAVFALGKAKTRAIGLNSETDSALALLTAGVIALGLAVESDSVFSMTPVKTSTEEPFHMAELYRKFIENYTGGW